ncbi:hypothetical protein, partial [Acinetobacter baumannii]|uniref:hypothetical protein n=1 Tax=Acinetobacter baumannii TaxID=470 RepID=UPI001C8D2684
ASVGRPDRFQASPHGTARLGRTCLGTRAFPVPTAVLVGPKRPPHLKECLFVHRVPAFGLPVTIAV